MKIFKIQSIKLRALNFEANQNTDHWLIVEIQKTSLLIKKTIYKSSRLIKTKFSEAQQTSMLNKYKQRIYQF